MLKPVYAIIILALYSSHLLSQKLDIGLQVGGAFYDGDLSMPDYFSNVNLMNPAVGFVLRGEVSPGFVVRAGVLVSRLQGDDSRSDLDWQLERDVHFESPIFEATAILELHPLSWTVEFEESPWSPYVFGGVGLFKFDPQSRYDGELVELQPLGTEGQGLPGYNSEYDLQSFILPFGVGLRYQWGNWMIDLEYGVRRTDTDYLDDTSGNYVSYDVLLAEKGLAAAELGNKINAETGDKRGNQGVKDWYTAPVLTIAYRLNFENTGYISR